MRRSIRYGEAKIVFTIRFAPLRQHRMTINVMPDGAVLVDAPEHVAPEAVVAAVRQRARWIWQQLEGQRERGRHVLPREYVSGESHFYLGRRYLLKVMKSAGTVPGVKLLRGRLEVATDKNDLETVRGLLEDWYRQRAREFFARRIDEWVTQIAWLKAPPAFQLREMRTQWGSCSPNGMLLLNPHLIKAPRPCVDYVLAHELCHLKIHSHSPAYYRLLGTLMPDWAERKRELDSMA